MFRMTCIYLFIVSAVLLLVSVSFADEVTDSYRDGLIQVVKGPSAATVDPVSQEESNNRVVLNPVTEPLAQEPVAKGQAIKDLVGFAKENTACLSSKIPNRGRVRSAPGAFYGLTVTMARSVCRGADDPIKKGMMNGRPNSTNDVFIYYPLNGSNERNTMVSLYGLMLSHIHRETSGKFWEGVDTTNSSSYTSNTAEAGLCQTSNNINTTTSPHGRAGLRTVIREYSKNNKLCLKDLFSEGMKVRTGRRIIGTGAGAEFQRLMRSCPAAALEHCAVAVRHVRRHYGPLNRRESKAIPACQSTFEKVYDYTKKNQASVCPQLGITN